MGLFGFLKRKPRSQTAENDRVRARLATFGDSGVKPRHTIHYAYPKRGAQGAEAASFLVGRGFTARATEDGKGMAMEHHVAVVGDAFDRLTEELAVGFSKMGWTYDGWECAMEPDDEA